jgi:hypothetical protein
VIATVLIVTETVFDSATVELSVPVATPLALVVPTGWVSVFPVPVAASTTVAPAIGFPLPSFAVTVMVELPLPAVIGEMTLTVDCVADTAPAVPVAVNVTGLPESDPDVAVSVFVPAVGLSVHEVSVAMPSVPVLTAVVGAIVPLPAAGVNVTATLATGLPFASFTITDGGAPTAVPAGAV